MPVTADQPPSRIFDRFSERACQIFCLAGEEARMIGTNMIGTEHLLLGVEREEHGLGARVLRSLDVTEERLVACLGQTIVFGDQAGHGPHDFTPHARDALTRAIAEAEASGSDVAATHHVLLGLLGEDGCTAVRVLLALGVRADQLRGRVIADVATAPAEWPTSPQQLQEFRSRPRSRVRDSTAISATVSPDAQLAQLREDIQQAHVALQEASTDRERFFAREKIDIINGLNAHAERRLSAAQGEDQ